MFINDIFNEDSWSAGDNQWSSEHDQWAKESAEVIPALTGVDESHEDSLNIGDEVLVTYPNQFQGKRGEITGFGRNKAFVIIEIDGREYSMHSSDVVSLGNDEEDDDYGLFGDDDREELDEYRGPHDKVTFEIDSEKAYNHVMDKFGHVIDWSGDYMTVPERYWPAVKELAFAAGGDVQEIAISESKICPVCGCTPCNCTHITNEDWKDVAKLAAIPAIAGAAAVGGQYLDDQHPKVDIGGRQVMVVDNPGWGTIPSNAMTLTGKDGKEYKVWKPSGKGTSQWLATPVEAIKEGAKTPAQKNDFKRVMAGAMSRDEYNKKYKLGKYAEKSGKSRLDPTGVYHNLIKTVSEGATMQDVFNAITYRIERQMPELFTDYGVEVVTNAIKDVAEFYEGAEEIGSSDVGSMVREVVRNLKQQELRKALDEVKKMSTQQKFEKHLAKYGYDVNAKQKYWDQKLKDIDAQIAAWDAEMERRKQSKGVAEGSEWDEYTGGNPFPDSDDDYEPYGGEHDPDDLDESSGTEYRGFDIRPSHEYGTSKVIYWIYYRGRCTEYGNQSLDGAKKDIDYMIAAGFFNDPDEIARKKQQGLAEGSGQTINIGDDVVIIGNSAYAGVTGRVIGFREGKIVVDMLEQGKVRFAPERVKLYTPVEQGVAEAVMRGGDEDYLGDPDYEDRDNEDEGFFVAIGNEEDGVFLGMITRDGGRWREVAISGNPPYNWGGANYMSYLSPQDVQQWINKDYGRYNQVEFFDSEEEARDYVSMMSEDVMEGFGAYDNDKGIRHTRESLVAKLESLPKGDEEFEWHKNRAIYHLKQGNMIRARYYMAKMKRGEQGVAEGKETINIGDDVVIIGNSAYAGVTGRVIGFREGKIVVDMLEQGKVRFAPERVKLYPLNKQGVAEAVERSASIGSKVAKVLKAHGFKFSEKETTRTALKSWWGLTDRNNSISAAIVAMAPELIAIDPTAKLKKNSYNETSVSGDRFYVNNVDGWLIVVLYKQTKPGKTGREYHQAGYDIDYPNELGVAEGFLGDREYNRVMPFVKRIASEVSDYDRDEFGEELWSLLDQKYGPKFAQSVLDDIDFYWDTYTELTDQQGVAEGTGDVVTVHQHQHGADMGKYGTFNIERETPTIIVVYDHKTGEMLKFNRATGRGIGSASQLMIKQGVSEGEYDDPRWEPREPDMSRKVDWDIEAERNRPEEPGVAMTVTVTDYDSNVVLTFPSTGGYYGDVRYAKSKGFDTEAGDYDINWKRIAEDYGTGIEGGPQDTTSPIHGGTVAESNYWKKLQQERYLIEHKAAFSLLDELNEVFKDK